MPECIQKKAAFMLAAFLRGELRARKCPRYRSHYLAMNVNGNFRLLCLHPENAKNPNAWQVCNHAKYETLIAKR